jgi:hypothetical protein
VRYVVAFYQLYRNDDLCGDWFEPDDEYNSQFPRAADEGGWGIDESMYVF